MEKKTTVGNRWPEEIFSASCFLDEHLYYGISQAQRIFCSSMRCRAASTVEIVRGTAGSVQSVVGAQGGPALQHICPPLFSPSRTTKQTKPR